jgi:hypothetical protein
MLDIVGDRWAFGTVDRIFVPCCAILTLFQMNVINISEVP